MSQLPSHPTLTPFSAQVGASEATLLSKLGIKPFSYGLVILQVYDSGSLYDPKVGGPGAEGLVDTTLDGGAMAVDASGWVWTGMTAAAHAPSHLRLGTRVPLHARQSQPV